MQFIIMDLEWNNTYAKKANGYINEIIEIGAVKLDDDLETVDTFSCIIRSQIGKKLRGTVKRLTHLTNADINAGMPFTKAFSLFRKWIGNDETVIITWGDGDIRVLLDNFKYLNGIKVIPFLRLYCDLQKCFQKTSNSGKGQQTGLLAAAEIVGIDPEMFIHHRALGDSMLTAEILKKVYPMGVVSSDFIICDDEFYSKLLYKAKVIRNIDNPLVDKKRLNHTCESCGSACVQLSNWKFHCQFFRANFYCEECDLTYSVGVRFKKLYDQVEFRKIVSVKEPEPKIEAEEIEE
ncbi:MAG: exonuclease domain-containing protein [Clostridia bacterium]|nr:exonuclease domain-containing protein [Clostridia bacterium]